MTKAIIFSREAGNRIAPYSYRPFEKADQAWKSSGKTEDELDAKTMAGILKKYDSEKDLIVFHSIDYDQNRKAIGTSVCNKFSNNEFRAKSDFQKAREYFPNTINVLSVRNDRKIARTLNQPVLDSEIKVIDLAQEPAESKEPISKCGLFIAQDKGADRAQGYLLDPFLANANFHQAHMNSTSKLLNHLEEMFKLKTKAAA